jgi:hypothetical protein
VAPTGTKGRALVLPTVPDNRAVGEHQPGLKPYLVLGAEIVETKGILSDRRKVSCVVVDIPRSMHVLITCNGTSHGLISFLRLWFEEGPQLDHACDRVWIDVPTSLVTFDQKKRKKKSCNLEWLSASGRS